MLKVPLNANRHDSQSIVGGGGNFAFVQYFSTLSTTKCFVAVKCFAFQTRTRRQMVDSVEPRGNFHIERFKAVCVCVKANGVSSMKHPVLHYVAVYRVEYQLHRHAVGLLKPNSGFYR